jgi:hypothetical protein
VNVAALVLAYLLGVISPYLWQWLDWNIGRRRRDND